MRLDMGRTLAVDWKMCIIQGESKHIYPMNILQILIND